MPKIPKPPTAPKGFTKTTINLPTPLHKKLKRKAKDADRTISWQAASIIKEGLES